MRTAFRSDTRTTTLTATHAPAKTSVEAEGVAVVVAEADPFRRALVLSFNAHLAGGTAKAPVPAAGVYALVRLDDGRERARVPSWADYTFALAPGETLSLGDADAPLALLRVAVALDVGDAEPGDFVFRVVCGEHGADTC